MQGRAAALDESESFPAQDIQDLRGFGILSASFEDWRFTLPLLRLLGQGNPAVGRLIEAHVNAVRLVQEFGTPDHRLMTQDAIQAGGLFGLWVTDGAEPLRWRDGRLSGGKAPCSGAGHATHAVITAETGDGTRLGIVALRGAERVVPMRGMLPGMRAAVNGAVGFDGVSLPAGALFGPPGAYLQEPSLSTGAWRTSAVTSGALDALVDAARERLMARGHDAHLLQQDRFGRIAIGREAARLWVHQAAQTGEDAALPVADRVAYVNLARIAVEAACLDAITHIQRALGLAAFIRPSPVERLLRDLSVYLRQPAPDAVLTEAGLHAMRRA